MILVSCLLINSCCLQRPLYMFNTLDKPDPLEEPCLFELLDAVTIIAPSMIVQIREALDDERLKVITINRLRKIGDILFFVK